MVRPGGGKKKQGYRLNSQWDVGRWRRAGWSMYTQCYWGTEGRLREEHARASAEALRP